MADPAQKRPASGELTGREKRRVKYNNARRMTNQQDRGYKQKHGHPKIDQIQSIQSSIANASYATNFLAFQCVPKTLRRRTASRNAKRLPRCLRHWGEKDIAKSPPVKRKPKQCKKRPKTRNLVEEYKRRQLDKKQWLETHIWHTKRMKMETLWGYRLAKHLHFKSQRPAYRSFSHLTVMHDSSYIGCLEWEGARQTIQSALHPLMDPGLPSLASARFANGQRIGYQFLYQCYPTVFFCPVMFLWCASDNQAGTARLWMWLHPSCFDQAHGLFLQMIQRDKLDIQLIDRRLDLVRFDFSGPQSTTLLQAILDPVDDQKSASSWHALASLRSTSTLPPGSVLAMNVKDPRLAFPQKIQWDQQGPVDKAEKDRLHDLCLSWPTDVAQSMLWDQQVCRQAFEDRPSEQVLIQRRQDNNGGPLDFTDNDVTVPIVLIQRGQTAVDSKQANSKELTEGWTLVMPRGWAMAFWKACSFAGARAAGLNEMRTLHFESGVSFYPFDHPGTEGWRQWREDYKTKADLVWQRRPPAKRANYTHLGRQAPFEAPFETLVPDSFWVVYTKRALLAYLDHSPLWSPKHTNTALVTVRIVMTSRGKPVQNAAIRLSSDPNPIIGYMTSAGFSMTESCGAGIGVCTLAGLVQLMQATNGPGLKKATAQYQVLIQNPSSSKHRPAQLSVHVV
ncbi:POP1-domain-containing protein [Hesseltinella vesiculosa]|uniref:POP1-domain-containing protein n=1 Tax=Hesseltinella vesiculosa TaxID=101127 RepID=A0A1X2G914_9FUNG|nr:POP1-domain-containing protein [Hesseltinella vesiculosa]